MPSSMYQSLSWGLLQEGVWVLVPQEKSRYPASVEAAIVNLLHTRTIPFELSFA